MSIDLRDLTYAEMEALMQRLGERRFRAGQLFRWVHGRGATSLEQMSDVSKLLKGRLRDEVHIARLGIEKQQISIDGTRKLRLRTHDERVIESVLIPDGDASDTEEGTDEDEDQAGRPKLTLCVSSQAGCALDCAFCATAQLGFGRQLSASEIVSQVYQAEQLLAGLPADDPTRRAGAGRVTNLVFMGMGEPLHNYDNLARALSILLHPGGRGFSRRRVTVSTAGLVPAIRRFASEPLKVNLAVSLNATTDEQRDVLMPINRKYKLAALLAALREIKLERRQRITIEYVLLGGVNDSLEDARRLPGLLAGIPCKLNLIPWNPHPGAPFRRPAMETVLMFQREVMRLGVTAYLRKTRGGDIDAACGQLAAEGDARAGARTRLARYVRPANPRGNPPADLQIIAGEPRMK